MPAPRRRSAPLAALVAVLVALALVALGAWIGARHPEALPAPVRTALAGPESNRVVREALDRIERSYYRKIPSDKLADDAIAGVVARLDDRFSQYFTPAEYRRFKDAQSSRFTGVGVAVAEDPLGLRVVHVYDGSPAQRAGIRRGDRFIAAGGRSLKGLSSDRATALVKGPQGTDVRLTVRRAGRDRTLTVRRAQVAVPVVESAMREVCDRKIGVVSLSQFSSGAHGELYTALRRLVRRGARAIVFDLRGNGGGLVDEAQLVASAFLRDGAVVTTRGRSVPERTLEATGEPIVPAGTPLVVLTDEGTASASEIVAGALQDHGRAKLVGRRTFGKGVFQEVIELSNGGALDITAGQYFTPKGRNLGGRGTDRGAGLQPDVKVADGSGTRGDGTLAVGLRTVAREAGCQSAAGGAR